MTPSLEAFFAAQARFFAGAASPDAAARDLLAAFPGWSPDPRRVALYAELTFGTLQSTLSQVFPACRAALPAATWRALAERYLALGPATHYEINQAAAPFPGFVEALAPGHDLPLPPFLPALARLEWTTYAVYASPVELPAAVERLTLNPTAELLEHGWALCAYLRATPPRAEPARADEVAVLWRDPHTLHTRSRAADARTLLAIKVAVEGIDLATAAAAGGVPVGRVEAAIAEQVRAGLLLAPG